MKTLKPGRSYKQNNNFLSNYGQIEADPELEREHEDANQEEKRSIERIMYRNMNDLET